MSLLAFPLFLAANVLSIQQSSADTLQLVQVIHRHGARTPEYRNIYPTDPHGLEAFLPMGYGQLTNLGKQQAYKLGKVLRQKYGSFLGGLYTPDMVFAQSTDYDRTKASLLLVLAALFKPATSELFENELSWQPIPINYTRDDSDFILTRPNSYCPNYIKELDKVVQSEKVQFYVKKHKTILNYLSEHSGKTIDTLKEAFELYQTLKAESKMNLTLPEWVGSVFPDDLYRMGTKQCELENYNKVLKRLNGGRLLGRVIKDMVAKSAGTIDPQGRKIIIYSGHEHNVMGMLAALNLYKPHVPNYAAAVIIELHYLKEKEEYAVKVLYLKDVEIPAEAQTLEGCDVLCPLKNFIRITKPHVPINYSEECGADSEININ